MLKKIFNILIFLHLPITACSEGSFTAAVNKKSNAGAQEKPGNPEDKHKPSNGDQVLKKSTDLDCSAKTANECKAEVEKILNNDATKDNTVSVFGCKEDAAKNCAAADKLGNRDDQVVLKDGQAPAGAITEASASDLNNPIGTGSGDNKPKNGDITDGMGSSTCTKGAPTGPIDFETLSVGDTISTQFLKSHGISFKGIDSGRPHVGGRGIGKDGWQLNNTSIYNQPKGGSNFFGERFLATSDGTGTASDLLINYAHASKEASFIIIDVDNKEVYTIKAYSQEDGEGTLLQTKVICASNVGGSVPCDSSQDADGLPTTVSFKLKEAKIRSITIKGTKPQGNIGVAFDNFSPYKICD